MLVAALIVKGRLKMPRENISGYVRKMIKPEGEVPYPKIQISLVMTKTGLSGLHCEGKDQMRPYPTHQVLQQPPNEAESQKSNLEILHKS